MRNARVDEAQAGMKIARRNINNLRYADEVKVKSLNHANSATLGTIAHQAPPSMGFSRQEYWSGLPFPSPGIFPTQGSNLGLPHCRQILYHLSHQGSQETEISTV